MAALGTGLGLEIGPLDSAIALKDAVNVRYVDVIDTQALRDHFEGDPNISADDIVEVDYALRGEDGEMRSLSAVVAHDAPFDWVLASHVVEHVPDLIRWLSEIASVTADDGQLLLVVPDRRYTFDVARPQTTVGQILQAYSAGDVTPSERAVFDHFRSIVTVPVSDLWNGRSGAEYPQVYTFEQAAEIRTRSLETDEYIDSHVWMFTPGIFVQQLVELGRLDLCDFTVESVTPTAHNELEFYVSLRRIPRTLTSEQVTERRSEGLQQFDDEPPPLEPSVPAPLVLSDREQQLVIRKRQTMAWFRRLRH
jgi:SAM-dependent methyltransferase